MDKQILDLLLSLLAQFRAESGTAPVTGNATGDLPASDQIAAFLDQVRSNRATLRQTTGEASTPFRVLHASERGLFSREGLGLLVELSSLGLMNPSDLEELIDYARLASPEPLSRDALLTLLPELYSGGRRGSYGTRTMLSANRTVH